MQLDRYIELVIGKPAPAGGRAEYMLRGEASAGGVYNSHVLACGLLWALVPLGWIHVGLAAWLSLCLAAALLLDGRTLPRLINPQAMPGQVYLYLQVLAGAVVDALPFYALAFLLYVGVAPYWRVYDLAVSSFVMLYSFYMIVRLYWLVRYGWLLTFRWEQAGRTFAEHEANLRSRSTALRHVTWAYFLGNVGLVVRCGSQVMTLALFAWLMQQTHLDLTQYRSLEPWLLPICVGASVVWAATLGIAIRRALLVYYRTHRTLHQRRALYDSIHGIHHRGVLPTPLDSGTISPAEFLITENALPTGTLVPNWWWTATQVVLAVAGHWPSHDVGTRLTFPRHHLQHHRMFNVNYGLTPAEDAHFGTLHGEASD